MPRILTAALLGLLMLSSAAENRPLLLISTENSADHVQTRLVQAFVERVQACCGDRLQVEHHYGGQLFRDRDVPQALAQGKVAMALPGTWQLGRFAPDVDIFMLPAFYGRSLEEVAQIQDGPVVQALARQIEQQLQVVVLGRWIGLGFADLFTADPVATERADLAGLVIRSPGGLASQWRLETLGARPVTIPWPDLAHVLQSGRLDGLLSTFATLDSTDLWALGIRHAREDHQSFSLYVPLVSDYFWRSLDDRTRQQLRQAWEAGVEAGRAAMIEAQSQARSRALASGVRIIPLEPRQARQVRGELSRRQTDLIRHLGIDPVLVEQVETILGP